MVGFALKDEGGERMAAEEPAGANGAGGCTVDWSWLVGREIAVVASDLQAIRFTFRNGETLVVQAALYRGEPFLSFMPWRAQ
jgi:hypothetical protein